VEDTSLIPLSQELSKRLIPGNIQRQARRGSEQPGGVEDAPAYCRGVGLDDL